MRPRCPQQNSKCSSSLCMFYRAESTTHCTRVQVRGVDQARDWLSKKSNTISTSFLISWLQLRQVWIKQNKKETPHGNLRVQSFQRFPRSIFPGFIAIIQEPTQKKVTLATSIRQLSLYWPILTTGRKEQQRIHPLTAKWPSSLAPCRSVPHPYKIKIFTQSYYHQSFLGIALLLRTEIMWKQFVLDDRSFSLFRSFVH